MFFFPITRKSRARYALARNLYASCIAQSRQKEFYIHLAVPDTFDGRFDLTSLHVGLMVSYLSRQGGESARLSQALFDEMFVNLDQTCREMGIGDLSVPRHMKRMMKAFKGRSLTYVDAMATGTLPDALVRNLYGTVARPSEAVLSAMSSYVQIFQASLPEQNLLSGNVSFPAVPALSSYGVSNVSDSQAA